MKSFFAIGAILCSIASAWPLLSWIQEAPPAAGTQFYLLQAKGTSYNDNYVTLINNIYTLDSNQTIATRFFVRKFNATNTWAFHTADDTRQVALLGRDGVLLLMTDVTNPNADSIPSGYLMEWATFTMDNNALGVRDGSTLTTRTWVGVMPRGSGAILRVALYDGVSNVTDTDVLSITGPLTLNIVRAGSASTSVVRKALQMIYG